MAVILRKPGAKPVILQPKFQSPFKESFHDDKALQEFNAQDKKPALNVQGTTGRLPSATPVNGATPSSAPKPAKKVIKLTGGKPISRPAPSPAKPASSLDQVAAGLVHSEDPYAASKALWPDVHVGQQVKITNSLFPWVKHYSPGDICKVKTIAPHINAASDDPIKYRCHILTITQSAEKSHIGNEVMMFRWEFIPHDPAAAPLPDKGTVNRPE